MRRWWIEVAFLSVIVAPMVAPPPIDAAATAKEETKQKSGNGGFELNKKDPINLYHLRLDGGRSEKKYHHL